MNSFFGEKNVEFMDMCVVAVTDGEHTTWNPWVTNLRLDPECTFKNYIFMIFCGSRSVINKVWLLSSWTMMT